MGIGGMYIDYWHGLEDSLDSAGFPPRSAILAPLDRHSAPGGGGAAAGILGGEATG